MKTIVVATDFSEVARNATQYGAELAKHIGADLHIVNVYVLPVGMSEMSMQAELPEQIMMPALYREAKNSAEESLASLKEALQQQYPGVSITTEGRLGNNSLAGITEYAEEVQPFLVVIGSHDLHGMENWGSTEKDMIKKFAFPFLAVPAEYKAGSFQKIALSSDLQPIPAKNIKLIEDVVEGTKGQLTIVHVQTESDESPTDAVLSSFPSLTPKYHHLQDEDVTEGLDSFLREEGIDILIVLPRHHNFWENLLGKEHTTSLLSSIHIPVLCVPE